MQPLHKINNSILITLRVQTKNKNKRQYVDCL